MNTRRNFDNPTPAVLRVLRAPRDIYTTDKRETLPDGARGTYATLDRMAAAARRASVSGVVRAVASAIYGQAANRDHIGALMGLESFLRSTVKFKADTLGAEVLVDPVQLLDEIGRNGVTACDCDDVATLGASIIRAMGHQPYFVVYRKRPGAQFVHVAYAASVKGSRPIPFDPQERVKPGSFTAGPGLREVVQA